MSKSTRGARVAGIAGLAVTLSVGVAAPAFAVPDFAFDRIGGEDRYQTAADVADEYGVKPDAIVANGQPGFYADALASNYLSGAEDAPILLTRIKELPQHTLDQLDQMNADNVWIVGGESVVPAEQEAQLESAGYNVTRIAGDDRFETNAKVLAADGNSTDGLGLIATGFNFPDALAAGPFAYNGHSLGLSTKDDVKDVVLDALEADGVNEVLIFGGTDAVGPGVVADLASRGITVRQRFAGADRSETSELAAEWALANLDFTNKHVGVASGYTEGYGADALAGGPLEGMQDAPMLITRNVDNPDDVIDYLEAHCETLETGHIFGGPVAVSVAAEAQMEAAAQCDTAAGATSRPELVGAAIVDTNTPGELGTDGTTVRFTFDEEIATAANGTPPAANLFHVYNSAGLVDSGDAVVSQSGSTVNIRFNDVNADSLAAALTLATVDFNAVEDAGGAESPEGDAPLNTTTGGGQQTLPAGTTDGPDLVSVGSFTADGANTEVAFTFDEAATLLGAATDYHLIPTDGSAPISGTTVDGGNNTTTHIVEFAGTLNPANFARGTVDAGTVEETTDNEANGKDQNVLQAADISSNGNTVDADLVSVALQEGPATGEDRALFTFDENVTLVIDPMDFYLYKDDGTRAQGVTAERDPANNARVLVTFAEGAIDRAVGGQTEAGAVVAADPVGGANEDDEVGVANTGTTAGQTAGKTSGPDLTAVSTEVRTDLFGNVEGGDATYTFDEPVATATATEFFLYLADGTRFAADSCAVDDKDTAATADDTEVVCEFTGPAGDLDRPVDAVLGTVDNGAVTAVDGAPSNPEGAEFVS